MCVQRRWRGAASAWQFALAAALTAVGCSQSLFDAHGPGGTTGPDGGNGGDGGVPTRCPTVCLADAAAAFDGTADGSDDRWRYLGDRRNRTWVAMAPVPGAMVGEVGNRIEPCRDHASVTACAGRPGALLVTSSGSSSPSDPAIEYTAPAARVVQLAVRVSVPGGGAAHRVRLYRNSREDVLFTGAAAPGATVAQSVTVDALAGDRFLVALEPTGQGGTAALDLFVSDAGKSFPAACRLALEFADTDIVGSVVADRCGGAFTSILDTTPTPPLMVDGPFAEHGMGLYLEPGYYAFGSRALPGGDQTLQFWVLYQASGSTRATVFSDIDEPAAHGHRIQFDPTSGLKLEAAVVSTPNPVSYASQRIDFPDPSKWHFVRIAYAGDTVTFCVDGTRVASLPLASAAAPGITPYLGRNGPWSPSDDIIAGLDDIRVLSDAWPCNDP